MSTNKLALFSTPQAKQRSRSKEQVASLKTNGTLFSRLYIACQARQCNLDTATGIEIGPNGMSNKVLTTASIHIGIDANALDGAAIVHMVRSGACRHLRSIPRKLFFRISPLSLKLLAE